MNTFKEEYGEEVIKLLTSCTYLDDNDVRDLTDLTIPGLDELMGLQQIIDFMETNEFDIYVWDTAPTGHTIRLLQMPDIIDQWVKLLAQMRWKYRDVMEVLSGKSFSNDAEDLLFNLKKTIRKVSRYFKNPQICRFIAVTIPEFMAVNELDRMHNSLRKLSMPVKHILVNHVMKEDNGCAYCKIRKQEQKPYLDKIRSSYSGFCVAEVSQRPYEIKG
jgi:arsenite-transporting ATPase